jgi:predicted phage terminase large subunit-like protein
VSGADPLAAHRAGLDVVRAERRKRHQAAARDHLLDFIRWTFPEYQAGWVHRELCAHMEWFSAEVAAKRSPRLMIMVPPRHGKSEIVSRRWPIWHLGRFPNHELVVSSYGQDLANDMSRDARRIRDVAVDLWPHLADGGKDGVELWETRGRGSYKAVGAGGPLTGRGAHALIIDDPFKNAEEAASETIRSSRWEWYTTTAYTRLHPGGGVLVMNTRWHHDDLSGRLLAAVEAGGDQWKVVNFPAVAEVDEPHRREGEPLHPERYDLDALMRIKAAIGSRAWAALYQQRPTPSGGGTFRREWFGRRYTFDPQRAPMDEIAIDVDATFKGGSGTDFVAMAVWGRRGWGEFYLLDLVRGRMTYVETKAALRDLVRKWHRVREVAIEEKANGAALIDDLRGEIPGIVAVNPTASKEARAEVAATAFEAGNVWLPERSSWVGDYVEEHLAFPNGAHDDMVDATSQRMIRWLERARKPDINAGLRFLEAFGGR